jgi:hypothetical protein
VEALEQAYARERGKESEDALAFAKDYEADAVFAKHWRPIMQRLAAWQP